jgi:aminoglycoside phosphotransferase (APT) family kinase protein
VQSRTKNPKSREQIDVMVHKAFGLRLADGPGAVRELKDGWFNAAYSLQLADGRDVILKIAPPANAEVMRYERNIMATEVSTMRLVAQDPTIPVPAILFHDEDRDVCDSNYFFMERIVGDNLEQVRAGLPPQTLAAVEEQVGAIIRAVNGFEGRHFGYDGNPELRAATWKEAFLRIMEALLADTAVKNVQFEFSCEDIRAAVHRHTGSLDEVKTPCLVHWDAWYPNFFVKDGRINGLIDFERALWADPLMEAQFRPLSWEGVTASMRGYGKTEFSPTEIRRCHLYTLHLARVMQVECHFRHYDTDDVFNNSRQMLAAAMAWLQAN